VQNRLIDDLLDVSRVISGNYNSKPSTELASVIEAAVESCRPAAELRPAIRTVFDHASHHWK